jgi:hypothetical protein
MWNIFKKIKSFGVNMLGRVHNISGHIKRIASAARSLPIPVISGIANDIANVSAGVEKLTGDVLGIVNKRSSSFPPPEPVD